MARRTVLVSDLSGDEIPDGKGATATITFRDARKGTIVLDLTDREAEEIGASGRRQARRGRKPKEVKEVPSANKPIEGVGTAIAALVAPSPASRRRPSGREAEGGRRR